MSIITSCSDQKSAKAPKKIQEKVALKPTKIEASTIDTLAKVVAKTEPNPGMPPQPLPPGPIDPEPPCPKPPRPEPPYPEPPYPRPQPPIPIIDPVVDFPDVEAEFPGGAAAMMAFINKSIEYPQIDKEMGNQGRVFVSFVVEHDGSISNTEVMRSVSKTLDIEAKRILRTMPKWKPAEVNGKIVRSRVRIPINFTLM